MQYSLPVLGSCQDCRFWVQDDEVQGLGACHRYAPRPVPIRDGQALSAPTQVKWPTTYAADVCGEWLPRPTDTPQT